MGCRYFVGFSDTVSRSALVAKRLNVSSSATCLLLPSFFPCGKAGAGEEGNDGGQDEACGQKAGGITSFQVLEEETGRASSRVRGEGAEDAPDHVEVTCGGLARQRRWEEVAFGQVSLSLGV